MGIGYCIKCKSKREVSGEVNFFSKNGVPMAKGKCSVCGSGVSRMFTPAERAELKNKQLKGEDINVKTQGQS